MRRTFPIASVLSRSLQPWPSKKPKNGCVILVVRPRAILHRLRSDGLRVVILIERKIIPAEAITHEPHSGIYLIHNDAALIEGLLEYIAAQKGRNGRLKATP